MIFKIRFTDYSSSIAVPLDFSGQIYMKIKFMLSYWHLI